MDLDGLPGNCRESQRQSAEEQEGGAPDSAFAAAQVVAFQWRRRRFGGGIRAGRGIVVHQQVVLEGASRWAGDPGGSPCLKIMAWNKGGGNAKTAAG